MEFINLPPRVVDPGKQMYEPALGTAPGLGRLKGRRAVVVGGGQRRSPEPDPPFGNGRAITHLFAREGAQVACLDLSSEAIDETVSGIVAEGGTAFGESIDVADGPAIAPVLRRCADKLGGLDALVVNVGITSATPLELMTAELWDHQFAVNLRSHMLFSQQAIALMDPGSSIVLVSSTAALFPGVRQPAYETSKAGVVSLSRSVAKAGEPKGIRCNCLLPGLIDTPMGRDEGRHRLDRGTHVPFGRQGTAWEIAYAALFLISHEASYVNAQSLTVDGGHVLGIVRS